MAAIASSLAQAREGQRKIGFKREHGMFEVYEDLMAKMEVAKHFYNVTVHGKEFLLMKSSLGLFRPEVAYFAKVRYWTVWLTEWRKFDYIVLVVIILNCILMAHPVAYDSAYRDEHPALREAAWSFNVFSTLFFACECLLKIVARGLIFSAAPDVPYLRDALSWLDLAVVAIGLLEIFSVGNDETDSFVVFRSLRVARALRTMHILPHLRMIVVALVDSGTRLLSWSAFVGFIFTVFAIVGNSLFGVVYWQRCRLTEAPIRDANGNSYWPIDPAQTRFCGGRYECQPLANGNLTFCGSPVDAFKGVVVDYDPWPEITENPMADYGYTGFQTFQAGMLTIFQVSTMEGWSKLMYRFQDGKGTVFAVCFFGICVLFGGLLLMNLVLAILWERFDMVVREEVTKEKSDKQVIPERILKKRLHELVTEVSAEAERRAQSKVFRQLDTADRSLGMKNITYSIATNAKWVAFMDFIVVLNAVVLACDTHPPMDETAADILEKLNALCTIAFMIEVSLKMLGYGMNFFSDQFNVFDLVLVLVSFIELMGLEGETSVSALRTARLLRLFKMMKMQMSIRVLMGVLQRATIPTYNFSVIAMLCLFCFAMLFTQMLYETEPDSSMLSFHDIGWAYVSVFSLLGTDGFFKNMIAFCKVGTYPLATLVLFVSGLIVGHIVLMNLFLGIFAAAFAQSRDELLDEYRMWMLKFETPDPEEQANVAIQDNFDKEEVEHYEEEQPSSPRWPHDVPLKVCTSKNMNLFKMMSIKKAAAQRKSDKGEALMWKRDHEILHIFKRSATELLEKAGIPMTPSIQEGDSTKSLASGDSKILVPVASHNASPPAALDCKDTSFEAEVRTPIRQTPSTNSKLSAQAKADMEAPTPAPIFRTPVANHFAMPPSDATESRAPDIGRDDGSASQLHRLTQTTRSHRTLLDRHGSSCLSGSALRHRVTSCQARRSQAEYPSFRELYQRAKEPAESYDFAGGPCELSNYGTDKRCSLQTLNNEVSTSSLWGARHHDIASRVRIATRYEQVAEEPSERSNTHRSESRHQIEDAVSGLQADSQDFAVPIAAVESEVPAERLCEPVGVHSAVPAAATKVSMEELARHNHLSKIERIARRIVTWRYFESANFILIFVSSLSLACENPSRDPRKSLVTILMIMEVVVTVLFTAEMFVKLVAFGVWVELEDKLPDTQPYFRVGWNWIDAVAVGSGLLGLLLNEIAKDNPVKMVRVVRLIRVMRPLRLLKRNKGMCLIVESLLAALPTLLNMIVIAGLFYLGFGILFVNMLKGSLGYCSLDPRGKLRPDIVTKDDCLMMGGEWLTSESNFDHIGRSLLTLLHVGTGESWIEVMMTAGSSQGIDMQPRPNSRAHLALLVVVFVAVTNFFLLNLFIGVLVDQYMVTKAELAGADVLTAEDRRWLQLQQEIFLRQPDIIIKGQKSSDKVTGVEMHQGDEIVCEKPYTLYNRIRRLSFWIVRRSGFDPFIILNIIGNTVVLVIGQPTDSQRQREFLANLSFAFVIVFTIEALLKILAYRFPVYWQDHWNRYDFVVVVGSVVSAFADLTPGLKQSDFALVMSSFRVARLFRLARFVTFLQIMAQVLWTLLLGLLNVSGLLGLVLFIYACLGVGLFATVMDGERLGPDANFHTFGSALLLLLRVATGEQWQFLMYDVVSDRPGCVRELQSFEELSRDGPRGCGAWLGYPYFVSYILVVGVVLINLIIAVVLDGFTCVQDMDAIANFKQQFEILRRKWHQLDPEGTGYLEFEDCIKMLREIDQPIGLFGHPYDIAMLHMRTLPLYSPKKVHAREVITLVAKRAKLWLAGNYETELSRASLDSTLERNWNLRCGVSLPPETQETLYVAHLFVARRVGKYYQRRQDALKVKILQEMQQEGRKSTIDDMNSREFSDMLRKERSARISAQRLQEQRLKEQEKRRQNRETVLQSLDEQMHKVEEELPHLQQKLSPLPWPPRDLF